MEKKTARIYIGTHYGASILEEYAQKLFNASGAKYLEA